MPSKPPTRQTPTPRYTVDYERSWVLGIYRWRVVSLRGRVVSISKTSAEAERICRALNASRSKGKP